MACSKTKCTTPDHEPTDPVNITELIEIDALNDCDEPDVITECGNDNPECVSTPPPQGKCLDSSWLGGLEVKCATLLVRVGNRLAKLTGEGAL